MKINILYAIKNAPWGGGNQFLKALKNEFVRKGFYENNPAKADIILFNSHQNLKNALDLKLKYPDKNFFHRVDGPVFLIRNRNLSLDKMIFRLSEYLADFTIFQSHWSFKECKKLGFKDNPHEVISNAADKIIFNHENKKEFSSCGKTRIIATSWSKNMNKGFDFYKFLDNNLNFNKYEMVFAGNSPLTFKNILHIPPLSSQDLSLELKKSDIFITASKNDPCSNSLLEALACGLPCVAYKDGGHPELIKEGGETFSDEKELLEKINRIRDNHSFYKSGIPNYDISEIADKYISVFQSVKISRKKLGYFRYLMILLNSQLIRFENIKSFIKSFNTKR
jgi:glycosyltransferase involved in cell wall biosynthesis